MALSFELDLDERHADRVYVRVRLATGGPMRIDCVGLQLLDPEREPLSPRLTLPISGVLSGPLVTRAELRSDGMLPKGCTVMGTVWWDQEQLQTCCPADPGTALEQHMLGLGGPLGGKTHLLEPLTDEERETLGRALPWLACFRPRHREHTAIETEIVIEEPVEDVVDGLGLADDDARWLKELLAED